MLTGSGVDEAWATGTQLGESVVELMRAGKPFTQENLAATYEKRRRSSWVERGARAAENARNGFYRGFVQGMIGMALAGMTGGKLSLKANIPPAYEQIAFLRPRNEAEAHRRTGSGRELAHSEPHLPRCAAQRAAGRRFRWMAACWSRSRTRC
jgi:flavin-dependent dehydrogenase